MIVLRYQAFFGPKTMQLWLYDNENDSFIDPPLDILKEADKIIYKNNEVTSENLSEAESWLESVANADPEPTWLHDGNEFPADDWDT